MRTGRLAAIVLATGLVAGCAAKAQVRTEVELPPLDPPPPPPRVVAVYPDETEPPAAVVPAGEPVAPARPPARPARQEPRPEPARPDPKPRPVPPSLTLTPAPGTETQTEAAIRGLMSQAARDLARVNTAELSTDTRTQFDTARRFLQQAEDALKARNIVFAGKLADKAATMAAALVR